jgi:hypothetical protein
MPRRTFGSRTEGSSSAAGLPLFFYSSLFKGVFMKRLICSLTFLLAAAFAAAEADHPLSVAAGGALNMFSRDRWSPAGNIQIDYQLDEVLTLGLKGGCSVTAGTAGYDTVNTIEIALVERFYLLNRNWFRLYFQGSLGAVILHERDYRRAAAQGGGTLGVRFYFKYWFAEVYGAYGYPVNFDLGLFLGHSFAP